MDDDPDFRASAMQRWLTAEQQVALAARRLLSLECCAARTGTWDEITFERLVREYSAASKEAELAHSSWSAAPARPQRTH